MYIDDDELRSLYKISSSEHIQSIESALLRLEQEPDNASVLKELLRSAHTLKGDSRMLGVEDVETLVHQMEECLMPIEKGQSSMTSQLCDRLYTGLDTVKQLAHTAVTGEPNDVDMFYILATLMGDNAAPRRSRTGITAVETHIQPEESLTLTSLDLENVASESWLDLVNEDIVFDTPRDVWLNEDTFVQPSPAAIESKVPPISSQLQVDFLELASELFPTELAAPAASVPQQLVEDPLPWEIDSTLPTLPAQTDLGDFNILPTSDLSPVEMPALLADDLTLMPNPLTESLDSAAWIEDPLPTGDESIIFASSELIPLDSGLLIPLSEFDMEPLVPEHHDTIVPPAPEPTANAPVAPAAPAATNNSTDYQIETIRVDTKQLDALTVQTGEINVVDRQIASRLLDLDVLLELWERGNRDYQQLQTQIAQIPSESPLHRQLSRNHQQWEQMGELINKFKKAIGSDSARLDLLSSALESGVKQIRLMPLSTIFSLFPRMVRDLAKTQAKEIHFQVEGGELLLDKRLLEEIKDPLMHILRNAIDHGIETSADRQQRGKPAAATLTIQVRQTGAQTTIEIADDGRGLNLQQIKATAIKRGIHTKEELDRMSVDRIQSLIFAAGFSTRTRVTELSGRGVGLDIVRTNIEKIKGTVEVDSTPDRGCTFRITLNQTIGSSQVMMVEIRNRIYAVPVEAVDRMLLVKKEDIFSLGGTTATDIGGQSIAVAWLADLLDLPPVAPNYPSEIARTSNSVSCLLLKMGRQQLAVLVDRIVDRQLITLEPPHPILKNVPHLSGATILGTGEVCLVLNPSDLFTTAGGGNSLVNKDDNLDRTSMSIDRTANVLLVEDSLVIRTQMTRILKGAGYRVTVANDGVEGWEKLQAGEFDLVVSDVEMPRWSGLDLTAEIRKHSVYQDLPIVLVTTLAKSVDRERGFQAGANAYLTKGDFDQQLLLETLTRLI